MTPVVPNLGGFDDAMARLREHLDAEVVFHIPAAPGAATYPAGTAFDPETGFPMDPVLEPTSGGAETDVTVTASVLKPPFVSSRDETVLAAPGRMESASMLLSVTPAVKASIEDATSVTVYGERQQITEVRPDGAFNSAAPDRWLIYLEGM